MGTPFLRQLRRDRSGVTAAILAGSIFAMVGAAALTVDLGSIYLAKRRLQGIADAAAMAAVAGPAADARAAAQGIVDRSGASRIIIAELRPGHYSQDKSLPPAHRFTPDAADGQAARIMLRQQVPLFFGALLSGKSEMGINAAATASRADLAAFSLASGVAQLSGGVANQLLSELAGTELGLTAADSQGLASADVDILHFADALRVRTGRAEATYAELFEAPIPIATIVAAMGDIVGGDAAGTLLGAISTRLGNDALRLADLIDLGPVGHRDFADGGVRVAVDALSLLRSALELSHGDHYRIDMDISALGLAGISVTVVGGQGEVPSPWMTITEARDVVIRTTQTRIYVNTRIGDGPLGLVAIRLPVYIELAPAEARLSDIACGSDPSRQGVTLAVTPAVGRAAIADLNGGAMANLTATPALRPALLAYTPLAQVHGQAIIALGGTTSQPVHFTRSDIDAGRIRTVSTQDLTSGIATSLMSRIQVTASLLGSPLLGGGALLGPLVSAVGSQLNLVAPALDLLLGQITGLLGVRLGTTDVRVDALRCGIPRLVA